MSLACDANDDENHDATRYAVDGILPPWTSTFAVQEEVQRWFSSAETSWAFTMFASGRFGGTTRAVEELQTRRRRTIRGNQHSKCSKLHLQKLPPWAAYVPENFSAGLPPYLRIDWFGIWEVLSLPLQSRDSGQKHDLTERMHVGLTSHMGHMQFTIPCVVYHLVLHVPLTLESTQVCGFLGGREQWCTSLVADKVLDTSSHLRHIMVETG